MYSLRGIAQRITLLVFLAQPVILRQSFFIRVQIKNHIYSYDRFLAKLFVSMMAELRMNTIVQVNLLAVDLLQRFLQVLLLLHQIVTLNSLQMNSTTSNQIQGIRVDGNHSESVAFKEFKEHLSEGILKEIKMCEMMGHHRKQKKIIFVQELISISLKTDLIHSNRCISHVLPLFPGNK